MAKRSWRRDYTQDAIDLKQRFDEAREHIGDPPDGQIPLGDSGIYTSPNLQHNQPVSPFNCEEYPDSPYCGGNPWSKIPAGFEPEWGINECGVWVQITPVLGFTKLPPVSAGYRLPGKCREGEKPPQRQPEPEDTSRPVKPLKFPKTIDPNVNVFLVLVRKYKYTFLVTQHDPDNFGRIPPPVSELLISNHDVVDTLYPTEVLTESYFPARGTGLFTQVPGIGRGTVRESTMVVTKGYQPDPNSTANIPPLVQTQTVRNTVKQCTGWITSDHQRPQVPNVKRYLSRPLTGDYFIINCSESGFINLSASVVIFGKINEIKKDWEGYVFDGGFRFTKGVNGAVNDGFYIDKEEWEIGYISQPDSNKYPPPPDQKRKRHCCMQCCTDNQKSNKQDQDLSEIKKMLKEIKKRLGTDEYPVKMPASLNADYNDSGQRSEPGTVTEENLTGVLGRFIRYFDGVMGELGVCFKVADADPSKEGDQPKFITAPNISELLSEIYSHVFDMWIMQYQFLQLDQRHAIESMLARKVGIQNYYLLECLIDWAGFKTKDVAKKIPFLFDIDAEGFEAFLKNKEQEIQIRDFNPDDEGADSFPDSLMRINRAAAIIEAVHSRKFKKDDDIPAKIMEMLKSSAKGVDRVNSDELKKAGTQEDFDQWLRDAEVAFINKAGQGDMQNPYGVPYAQRPRLTKIQDSLTGGADDGD